MFSFVQGWDLSFADFLPCYDVVNPFIEPHEICNSRASLDLLELIFWDLLGKVLRIVHANFREVSLRFGPRFDRFFDGVSGCFSAQFFGELIGQFNCP